jgi:hypothetical protein
MRVRLSAILALTTYLQAYSAVGQSSGCTEQLKPVTEVGARYDLGVTFSTLYPITHPGTRYLRAEITVRENAACDWSMTVRDKFFRPIQIMRTSDFGDTTRWTARVAGDGMWLDVRGCDGRRPILEATSYIQMPQNAKNPYYSFQVDNAPSYEDLYDPALQKKPVPEARRRLGDNVGFLMTSYAHKSWTCSGVMLREGLFLTNWHCGGIVPDMPAQRFWGTDIVRDTIVDLSWDGDGFSREYSGVELLAGSPTLDYALLKVQALDNSGKANDIQVSQHLPQDMPIFIIHHVAGETKKISECRVGAGDTQGAANIAPGDFAHTCDTEKGSSGAPVVNEQGQVVGIHHRGFAQNNKCQSIDRINRAVSMSAIVSDLKRQSAGTDERARRAYGLVAPLIVQR